MNTQTDQQLLCDYSERRSEGAFAEVVRRHVDFVYSAALRMVRDPHLAEDVTQGVFVALAANSAQLTDRLVLSGWLHRTARNLAAKAVRSEVRRRAREQESTLMNDLLSTEPGDVWEHVAPHLDRALDELNDADRDALLLRYFDRKSAREMAQTLGVSEEAAQKRVNRAIERLRELINQRGVAVAASGLVVVLSAHAVQAAPAGLAVTISTAAAVAGTTITAAATSTATKTIAMTTLQKAIITVAITAAVGVGIYEARESSRLHERIQSLQQQQMPLAEQLQAAIRERDDAKAQPAARRDENAELQAGQKKAELLKLRGEVGVLRQTLSSVSASNQPSTGIAKLMNDPTMKEYIHQVQLRLIKERYGPLFKELKLTPEETEKFTQAVGDLWLRGSEIGSNTNRTEAQQGFAETEKEFNSQLQSLLGQEGYARFNEFNREIPAQTTVKLLDDHLGNNRLNEEQSARLLQIVKAEPYEATHGIMGELDTAFFGSQADVDKHFQQVADSNQRILQQAATFLNAEQLTALATLQSNSVTAQAVQGTALTQKH